MACLTEGQVAAAPEDAWLKSTAICSADGSPRNAWAVEFGAVTPPANPATRPLSFDVSQEPPARRAVPVEYSDFYKTRARIHK
jgi:hypothetical protein